MNYLKTSILNQLTLVFFACLMITACSNSNDSNMKKTAQFVATVQQTKGPPIEPLPVFTNPKLPATQAPLKRNPFSPAVANNFVRPDNNHPKGPLESYSLDQLHLVGTLSQANQVWALISAPDGAIYNVSVGQYIGQNYGRIFQITPQKLIVQETISDGVGGWTKRTKELPMTIYSQQDAAP